jgi:hypothetical protein
MRLVDGSGVNREVHAPFCEQLRGKFPWLTLPACMSKLVVTLNAMVKHSSEWDATKGLLQAECL